MKLGFRPFLYLLCHLQACDDARCFIVLVDFSLIRNLESLRAYLFCEAARNPHSQPAAGLLFLGSRPPPLKFRAASPRGTLAIYVHSTERALV